MQAEQKGTHTATEKKESQESQGDLETAGKAEHKKPNAAGYEQYTEKNPEYMFKKFPIHMVVPR